MAELYKIADQAGVLALDTARITAAANNIKEAFAKYVDSHKTRGSFHEADIEELAKDLQVAAAAVLLEKALLELYKQEGDLPVEQLQDRVRAAIRGLRACGAQEKAVVPRAVYAWGHTVLTNK